MTGERVAALCAALALADGCWLEIRRSLRAGEGVLTALGVFLGVWAFALGLFAIPWVRYDPTSSSTWLMIYGSLLAFSIGSLLARRLSHRWRPGETRAPQGFNPGRLRLSWLGAAALGLLGLAGYIRAVDSVIGWHAIVHDPASVLRIQSTSQQFKTGFGSFSVLLYFSYVAVLLWTVGLRTDAFSEKWRLVRYLGVVPVFALLLPADRQLVFILVVWIAAFHILWRPPKDVRRLLARLAAGGASLLVFFLAVGAATGSSLHSHPEIKRALTTQFASPLAIPYVYVTANEPLLSRLAADPIRPHTDGAMTILPLVKLAHAAGIGGVPPEATAAFYAIPFDSYNSSTWLGPFLLDFGPAGAIILPFLCGLLFTLVCIRAARTRTLVSIWLGSLALYIIAFTPLNNELTIAPTWELALLAPVVVWLCREGPPLREQIESAAARVRSEVPGGIASVVALVAVCLIAVALVRIVVGKPKSPVLGEELVAARALLGTADSPPRTSDSFVLASRLQAARPAFTYVAVARPAEVPTAINVIGVFADSTEVTLSARSSSGAILTVRWPEGAPGAGNS